MPKLTTSYYSQKWQKYIVILEREVTQPIANQIRTHFSRKPEIEKLFKHELEHGYGTSIYFSDVAVRLVPERTTKQIMQA